MANKKAVVVKNATGRTGGTNATVSTIKKPTGKTGGISKAPSKAIPSKKCGGSTK